MISPGVVSYLKAIYMLYLFMYRWCLQNLSPVFRHHALGAYTSEESSLDFEITMKGHSQL